MINIMYLANNSVKRLSSEVFFKITLKLSREVPIDLIFTAPFYSMIHKATGRAVHGCNGAKLVLPFTASKFFRKSASGMAGKRESGDFVNSAANSCQPHGPRPFRDLTGTIP